MKLQVDYDWSPSPVGVSPAHALLVPRSEFEQVTWAGRLKNGVTIIVIAHDEVSADLSKRGLTYDGTVYTRQPFEDVFRWSYPFQGAGFLADARRTLGSGETGRYRNKVVTRLTDSEMVALAPIKMTHRSS